MDRLSLLLVIIGAINWGLVGLFQFDLIAFLFGGRICAGGPGRVFGSRAPSVRFGEPSELEDAVRIRAADDALPARSVDDAVAAGSRLV